MSDQIDIIAAAIKASVENFHSPVKLYIEPEHMTRWQDQNPDGDWFAQPNWDDDLESYRIIARAVAEALDVSVVSQFGSGLEMVEAWEAAQLRQP